MKNLKSLLLNYPIEKSGYYWLVREAGYNCSDRIDVWAMLRSTKDNLLKHDFQDIFKDKVLYISCYGYDYNYIQPKP